MAERSCRRQTSKNTRPPREAIPDKFTAREITSYCRRIGSNAFSTRSICNAASLTEDLDCRKQQSGNGELGKQHLVHGGADLAAQLGGHSFHFAAQFVHITP